MKYLITGIGLLLGSTAPVLAGGIERAPQSLAPLFEEGDYVELSFGGVDPDVSGRDLALFGGRGTGDVAQGYGFAGIAYKHQFNPNLSGAFIMEQPFGADIRYPGGESIALGGTFVEVKNSDIGAGSKVPHLTYVGDATIGEHTNIGASSVFVNYDGVNKNRTVIGDHCRTGSDTMFVAPVTVGDGAYTGAGAVVREDVPAGALALNAVSQRTLEGWVPAKRPGTSSAEAARAAGAEGSGAQG